MTTSPPVRAVIRSRLGIQQLLLSWATNALRDFPWRRPGRSPYELLVAEVLLKRTTAAAAVRVYEDFLREFPHLRTLVDAPEERLAQILSRVGLQWQRAKAIKALAGHLMKAEGGKIPKELDRLKKVPGLGDYSARAVLSFGYGKSFAVVDANVGRVLCRVFQSVLSPKPTQSLLQEVADALLPRHAHREFNFALLDLGSMICRYVEPQCTQCPLNTICDFYKTGSDVKQKSPLATRLREARLEKEMGLRELAGKASMSKLTIVNIEANRTTPKPNTIRRIASALGINPKELLAPGPDS